MCTVVNLNDIHMSVQDVCHICMSVCLGILHMYLLPGKFPIMVSSDGCGSETKK